MTHKLVVTIGITAIGAALTVNSTAGAAPHQQRHLVKTPAGTSGFAVQSILQVPHSSEVLALLSSGSAANMHYKLLRRTGHSWVSVKLPKRGGRYGGYSSLGAASTKTIYLTGSVQTSGPDDTPAVWHWTGHAFSRVKLPPLETGAVGAGQISFSSPTNAWVVGGIWDATNNQAALHLTGHTWTAVEHPADLTVDEGFISVATIGPKSAWAVNGDGTVQYWNGTSWLVGPALPAGVQPSAVAANKTASYVVGSPTYPSPAHPIILKWSGKTWARVKLPKGVPSGSLTTVGIAGKSVWAVGAHTPGNYVETPIVLHSNGGAWTLQKIKGSNHIEPGTLSVANPKRAWFGSTIFIPQTPELKSFIAEFTGRKWVAVKSK